MKLPHARAKTSRREESASGYRGQTQPVEKTCAKLVGYMAMLPVVELQPES